MEIKEIGLYIHIPFCKHKCYYCDFVSYANKKKFFKKYVECVKKEIGKYARENRIMSEHGLEPKYVIKTIYIGGGTPSLIDEEYIEDILKSIRENFEITSNLEENYEAQDEEIKNYNSQIETTIEVNPGTVTKEKLQKYLECGINRLSIGLQAVQDNLLKEIGRIHTFEDFQNVYKWAREVGFENINVDLMIGLPNQTLDDVKESTKKVMALKPEHISVYSLILEENTKLEDMVIKGKLELPDDEIERKMYWYVKKTLEKYKYIHYEISNFARPGFESKHNSDCWNQNEYIGIGAAASSFMNNARYENTSDLEEYISNIENDKPSKNIQLQELLDDESKIDEYMMLSLRKISGVNISEFKRKFNQNPIIRYNKILEKLIKEELIEIDGNNIRLSSKGIDLANLVWEEFI
jgi:oxygen-independent coproporphyrinogen-3 oxidase